jgi:hypothetical protein
VHIIGYSLGGQGAGHIGRTVATLTGAKARRLTGNYCKTFFNPCIRFKESFPAIPISAIEPASPYIEYMDPKLWVGKNDANFVDVLHTNSAPLYAVRKLSE